jgi:polysaccharide export outer membrane protein
MEAPLARRYTAPMMCIQRLLFASCVLLVFAGSAAGATLQGQGVRAPSEQIGADYRLMPGDQISIEVFGNDDLATTVNVGRDGTARMPLAGSVPVSGLSPSDAARSIEKALTDGQFLLNPQVTVNVIQSSSLLVSVLGEVAKPGRYPIEPNSTVLDVIALAGGINEKGSNEIYIIHKNASGVPQREPVDLLRMVDSEGANSPATLVIQSGDSIEVPKATFFITGQVTRPGEYRVDRDMILFEALARAGGVTPMGSASRVEVQRRGPNDEIIKVKVDKTLRIKSGDVILVKERLF